MKTRNQLKTSNTHGAFAIRVNPKHKCAHADLITKPDHQCLFRNIEIKLNKFSVTIEDIENHKIISDRELDRDLANIDKFTGETNDNNFSGNPFLYHFQLKNLLKCQKQNGKTIYDVAADPVQWDKLIKSTIRRCRPGLSTAGNIFDAYRINLGSVVMFKSTTAKYLYKKYNAKSVLDPTAGWGGRMLGAWSLGIDYTGIDTNIEMKPAYDNMIEYLNRQVRSNTSTINMIWDSCLNVDFSKIEYDFVLTSPPYVNLERYEHMAPWKSDETFYKDFFIPLWNKCKAHIKPGGHIAFNISPKMYDAARTLGLPVCHFEEDLKQNRGNSEKNKSPDKIYVWNTSVINSEQTK